MKSLNFKSSILGVCLVMGLPTLAQTQNPFFGGPINTPAPATGYAPQPITGVGEHAAQANCSGLQRGDSTRIVTGMTDGSGGGYHLPNNPSLQQ